MKLRKFNIILLFILATFAFGCTNNSGDTDEVQNVEDTTYFKVDSSGTIVLDSSKFEVDSNKVAK